MNRRGNAPSPPTSSYNREKPLPPTPNNTPPLPSKPPPSPGNSRRPPTSGGNPASSSLAPPPPPYRIANGPAGGDVAPELPQRHNSLSNKRTAPSPGGHTPTRGPAPPPPPASPTPSQQGSNRPPPPIRDGSGRGAGECVISCLSHRTGRLRLLITDRSIDPCQLLQFRANHQGLEQEKPRPPRPTGHMVAPPSLLTLPPEGNLLHHQPASPPLLPLLPLLSVTDTPPPPPPAPPLARLSVSLFCCSLSESTGSDKVGCQSFSIIRDSHDQTLLSHLTLPAFRDFFG